MKPTSLCSNSPGSTRFAVEASPDVPGLGGIRNMPEPKGQNSCVTKDP
jgi:hypothetical protein